jgi:hypothetical protein
MIHVICQIQWLSCIFIYLSNVSVFMSYWFTFIPTPIWNLERRTFVRNCNVNAQQAKIEVRVQVPVLYLCVQSRGLYGASSKVVREIGGTGKVLFKYVVLVLEYFDSAAPIQETTGNEYLNSTTVQVRGYL